MKKSESPNTLFTFLITMFRTGLFFCFSFVFVLFLFLVFYLMDSFCCFYCFCLMMLNQAPELIIYDNSCHLQEYCLSRTPDFFKNTEFLVDRLHWHNHTTCSQGHNISLYPVLSKINSQAAEQLNSFLARYRTQFSFMKLKNFSKHLSLFINLRNQKKSLPWKF